MKRIIDWIRVISRKQLVLGIVVFGVLVSATVAGVILYNYQQDLQEAYEEPGKKKTKKDKKEKEEDEKIEVIHQVRNISFSGTSIEKDLKITIIDENSELVTGVAFKITTMKEGTEDKTAEYTDEDMDGIIHVQELDGGMYTVKLHEVEHCVIKENPIKVEVKDKIEYNNNAANINATIIVDRENLKKILVGKNGSMIKEIGIRARKDIEPLIGRNVYLELFVKVIPKWRDREKFLNEIGFKEFNFEKDV